MNTYKVTYLDNKGLVTAYVKANTIEEARERFRNDELDLIEIATSRDPRH